MECNHVSQNYILSIAQRDMHKSLERIFSMSWQVRIEYRTFPLKTAWRLSAMVLMGFSAMGSIAAGAQNADRSGEQVVAAVCGTCHAKGASGAPKIGDEKAWKPLASRGLSSLTETALKGIRNMPAHGGNKGLSDIEIERAIVRMVNQSGGNWVEPVSSTAKPAKRSGQQIVNSQCIKCHEKGTGGAPKIGDREAWIPRLKTGLDPLVQSAVNGHGGMPPRGGAANLSDDELKEAITYMFNKGRVPEKTTK